MRPAGSGDVIFCVTSALYFLQVHVVVVLMSECAFCAVRGVGQ